MNFKTYNCDFGVKIGSTNYDFEHVDGLQIEDPETTRLLRGSNAKNKTGIVYTEGTKEPKKCSVTLIGINSEMHGLLSTAYANKTRVEFYCIDRTDGSSIVGKNAIITQQPRQNQVEESPESLNVMVNFETFDLKEVHKS